MFLVIYYFISDRYFVARANEVFVKSHE